MSKVIRTARVDGPVVVLGEAERKLYQDDGKEQEPALFDLAAMLEARVEAVRNELNQEWEERLQQERHKLQEAAEKKLEEDKAKWNVEFEEVHRQRYAEGLQEGVESKEAEAREAVERLDILHEALKHERRQVLLEAETLVVELASALALRVTRMQAEIDHMVLARVIHTALEHLSEHSNLVIKVHSEDLKIARKFVGKWVEKVDQDAVIKVQVGGHIGRGGCMIEGKEESIDARLEEQFEILKAALRSAVYGESLAADG